MKMKLFVHFLAGCLGVVGSGSAANQSYVLSMSPGYTAVANHLDVGGNTLDELFPAMPDGATFYKFDWASQSYLEPASYIAGFGWFVSAPEAGVLRPGEGAFIYLPTTAWDVTIAGTEHAFQQRANVGPGWNFISCQRLGDCGFAEVTGFGPQEGDIVYLFNQSFANNVTNIEQNASSIHRFGAAGWDSVPVFKQGRAAFVFLSDAPHITQQPASQFVPLGGTANFSVSVAGSPPFFYQWRFGNTPLPGRTSSTLTVPFVQVTNLGAYSVIVSNAFGTSTSAVAFLRLLVAPVITQPPESLTVTQGGPAQFRVAVTGSSPIAYRWFHGGQPVPEALQGRPILLLSNAQPADAGIYYVEVANQLGATNSPPAALTVMEPPVILDPPRPVFASSGQPVTFDVVAAGTQPLRFFWRLNGVVIPGETNATLRIDGVRYQDSGSYSVTVANRAGATSSVPVTLIVNAPPLQMEDHFSNRLVLVEVSGVGWSKNVGATAEPGEPRHYGKVGGHSVWIAWQAPGTGIATFRTAGSTLDTLLAAYMGTRVSNLVEVASDDDRGDFLGSEIRFNAVDGQLYQIAVDGFDGQEGEILLSWFLETAQEPLPFIAQHPQSVLTMPSNDVVFSVLVTNGAPRYQWFFDAGPIPGGTEPVLTLLNVQRRDAGTYFARVFQGTNSADSRPAFLQFSLADPGKPSATNYAADKFGDAVDRNTSPVKRAPDAMRLFAPTVVAGYAGTQVFSTYGSVSEPGEPVHCGVVGGASVWYYYTAPTNGTVYVTTEGSDYDTILAIYTGPGTSFSTLVEVACDNDSGSDGQTSKLSFPAAADTTYFIVVDGVEGATGWVNLNFRLLLPMVLSRVAGTNDTFRFRVSATPEYPFTIQRSSNLGTWTSVLTTNTLTGNYTFFESNITTRVQRFYRTTQTP